MDNQPTIMAILETLQDIKEAKQLTISNEEKPRTLQFYKGYDQGQIDLINLITKWVMRND